MSSPRYRHSVLLDAFELAPGQGKSMGIYNYTRHLVRALAARFPADCRLVVVGNAANRADMAPDGAWPANVEFVVEGQGAPGKLTRQLWNAFGAARAMRRLGCDVYFSPKGFLPRHLHTAVPGARSVIVVHDLIPLWYLEHHPNYFGRLDRLIVPRMLTGSARRADHVVAISQSTADDITRRLGRRTGLSVIHNGVPAIEPGPRPCPEPYLFAVTSAYPHKNSARLVEAYRRYRTQVTEPLPLILCGDQYPDVPGLTCVKGISDAALHGCYAHAEKFLFLSLIEGFGFPPLEAMRHGTPVVCSDIASLREVTDGLARHVDPTDIDAIARAIAEPAGPRPDAAAARRAIDARYTWARCAEGLVDCLVGETARRPAPPLAVQP
jgi:glycosyltransferase involved in cell wall biosynthesis